MADDIYKLMFDRENFKGKTWRNVPLIGNWSYAHMKPGRESELKRRKDNAYTAVRDNVRAGKGAFSKEVRTWMHSYNQLARELGEPVIGYKQIKNVRKKEADKLRGK